MLRCVECVDLNFDVLWDVEYVDLNFGVLRAGIRQRWQIVTDLDLQEFDGSGEQSLTWICRNSTAEAANQ